MSAVTLGDEDLADPSITFADTAKLVRLRGIWRVPGDQRLEVEVEHIADGRSHFFSELLREDTPAALIEVARDLAEAADRWAARGK